MATPGAMVSGRYRFSECPLTCTHEMPLSWGGTSRNVIVVETRGTARTAVISSAIRNMVTYSTSVSKVTLVAPQGIGTDIQEYEPAESIPNRLDRNFAGLLW